MKLASPLLGWFRKELACVRVIPVRAGRDTGRFLGNFGRRQSLGAAAGRKPVSPGNALIALVMLAGVVWFGGLVPASSALASEDTWDLAVSTLAMPDYARRRLDNGSFQPETYVLGRTGRWDSGVTDPYFDHVSPAELRRVTVGSLARQNYVPARDPKEARLLMRIYWGSTMESVSTEPPWHRDRRNAMLMGYESILDKSNYYRATRPMFHLMDDQMEEFHGGVFGRYFVIVIAFDYQLMLAGKKERPLWMTRFSLQGRGNAFNEQLAAMSLAASNFFGRPTAGLVHATPPEGHVTLGELKVIETGQ